MAKVDIRDWQRDTYIESDPPFSGGLTVLQLLNFARAIELSPISVPDSTTITCRHANDTLHLVGLSVHIRETLPTTLRPPTEGGE